MDFVEVASLIRSRPQGTLKQPGYSSSAAMASSDQVRPFRIEIPDSEIKELQARLQTARIPDQPAGTSWERGMPAGYLANFAAEHFEIESTGVSLRGAHVIVLQGLFVVRPAAARPAIGST